MLGEAKVTKVDKGKRIYDPTIATPPVTGILPHISINLDGSIDLGNMSPTEKLMLAAALQAQASQDLVKSENEDKKLILMSIDVLQKVASNVHFDSNNNPSGKLLQLIKNVNTNFDSLEKMTTQKVLERFKEVRK